MLLAKRLYAWITATLAVTLLLGSAGPCSGRVYIDISAPELRQIPTAIPVFKNLNPGGQGSELTQPLADSLARALDFTGFFKILDRGSFLENPQSASLMEHEISFPNWTGIGAELLIKGGFEVSGDELKTELRLYDTFSGRLVIGKRYTGSVSDQRSMILRFCNEIVRHLTGRDGVFNTQIAFVSTTSGNKEIYAADFDGLNPQQVTKTKSITLFPAWSSDGRWLAYTNYKRGKPDLYITNLKDRSGASVSLPGSNITPAWVPGQFMLAASLSYKGNPAIYLLSGKGEVIKPLTRHWGIDVSPTWSPDGKSIAFVSNRSGTPQIYVTDTGNDSVRRLTYEANYNTSPQWSPRGDYVAYTALGSDARTNICIIPSEGGNPVQLTFDSGNNESPTWSPDGSLIAFSSTREGPARIYVMNANGANQRRAFALGGEQTNPSWSPRLSWGGGS